VAALTNKVMRCIFQQNQRKMGRVSSDWEALFWYGL